MIGIKPKNGETLLVAEGGINACGHMDIAFRIIDMVKENNWDVLKWQMKTVDYFYTQEELSAPRQTPFGKTYGDYVRQRYFSHEEFKILDSYAKSVGVIWTATPFDPPAVARLMEFDPPYIKIASAKAVDKTMLTIACATGKPLFISTGMCDLQTIDAIVDFVASRGGDLKLLYHCVSSYPCNDEDMNLAAISTLRERYESDGIAIGLSSHDTGILSAPLAVMLGAKSLERHVTVDRKIFGSDQRFSLESEGMRKIARDVGKVSKMLGSGEKTFSRSELENANRLKRKNDFI